MGNEIIICYLQVQREVDSLNCLTISAVSPGNHLLHYRFKTESSKTSVGQRQSCVCVCVYLVTIFLIGSIPLWERVYDL